MFYILYAVTSYGVILKQNKSQHTKRQTYEEIRCTKCTDNQDRSYFFKFLKRLYIFRCTWRALFNATRNTVYIIAHAIRCVAVKTATVSLGTKS